MTENKSSTGDSGADERQAGGDEGEAANAPARSNLPPAARRALREAEERREAARHKAGEAGKPKEMDGRGGLDPVRYGEWEVNGLASDF